MPAVSRNGKDFCTGHGPWAPRKSSAGSSDVLTNSSKTLRETDIYDLHQAVPFGPSHIGVIAGGSSTVNVNGKPVARMADPISCGSFIRTGSNNVNAGDSNIKYIPIKFPEIKFTGRPDAQLKDSDTPPPSTLQKCDSENCGDLPTHDEQITDSREEGKNPNKITEKSTKKCGEMELKNPFDVANEARTSTTWTEKGHNPNIVSLWEEIGYESHKAFQGNRYTAWCATFVGATLKRSGAKYVQTPTARDYETYGTTVGWDDIQKGDVIVFYRNGINSGKGHVGFATGNKTNTSVEIIGGNQGDNLTIRNYAKQSGNGGGFLTARRANSCVDGTTPVPVSGTKPQPTGGNVVDIGGVGGKVS